VYEKAKAEEMYDETSTQISFSGSMPLSFDPNRASARA
jgi:hypothetical protein